MSAPLTNAEVLQLQAQIMVDIARVNALRTEVFTRIIDACPKLYTGCGLHLAIYPSGNRIQKDGHGLAEYNELPVDIRIRYEQGGDKGWFGEWIPFRGEVKYSLCETCSDGRDPFVYNEQVEEELTWKVGTALKQLNALQRELQDLKTDYKWLGAGTNPVPFKPCKYFRDGGNTWTGLDAYQDALLNPVTQQTGVPTNDPSVTYDNTTAPRNTELAMWWEGLQLTITRSWNLYKPAWIFVMAIILYFVVFRDKNRT